MSSGIFLIERDGSLVELYEQPYESEDLLQSLLASHPALLSGSEIDPEVPRRWLLVTREAGVPGALGAGTRWSVDHLFLDQEGVPTLVEVKRSADTRIRREVVGQMLDYAANGVVYWPVENVRNQFEARCRAENEEPSAVLDRFLGAEGDQSAFWDRVKTNLQAGRVRLLFVADSIPAELRRIVEFLNKQMDPAEVLAVEIRQFVSGDLRTLVPRVYGRTEQADVIKGPRPAGRQWDEASFLADLEGREGAAAVAGAKALLAWGQRAQVDLWWGRGARDGSFVLFLNDSRNAQWFAVSYTYGSVEIPFQYMKTTDPFRSLELRQELRRRLNEVPGVSIPADALERRPRVDLSVLGNPDAAARFTVVLDWMLKERRDWESNSGTAGLN